MKKMFAVIVVVISSISFCVASEVPQSKDENSEQINISAKLEKKLMESIVTKMQMVGRIDNDEVAKAKREINSLKFNAEEN
ncbi:MAG: hypothetical protein WC635_03065 [Bacteriovorax sp.]